jgi:NAD(P)-dependent dehydrogenase (short-subunit alcohol dehydrogenase family)
VAGDIAVVLGASGGIGGALVEALSQDLRFDHVAALSRSRPRSWVDDDRSTWLAADILDEVSLASAALRIGALGAPTFIIVATGMLHGDGVTPEKSLRALDPRALTTLFQVNAIGPALAARHLLPLTPRDRVSVFAALSARVGSIEDNALGGWYGYRASKAALNMLIRTAAIEHRRDHPLGVCVAIHPGTVGSALSAPCLSNRPRDQVFSAQTAADHILRVIDRLGPSDTGRFYAWDGSAIPW